MRVCRKGGLRRRVGSRGRGRGEAEGGWAGERSEEEERGGEEGSREGRYPAGGEKEVLGQERQNSEVGFPKGFFQGH